MSGRAGWRRDLAGAQVRERGSQRPPEALVGISLVVKVLEAKGWYVKRVRGSHHVMRHPVIPDAVPVRTAGISREEFFELL